MRAFFSTGVLAFTLAISGCSTSHGGDSDGGGDGGAGSDGALTDAGSGGDGSVGSSDGSGGGGSGGSGGGSVGATDGGAGVTGIDLVESCVAVCDYLVACHPMFDRVECVSDCLGTRGWLGSPMCEALTVELFECVLTLDCAELLDEDISTSICGPLVRELERECGDDGTRPDDPPPVEPRPAP